MERLTLISKARQRCLLMSLLKSLGRLRIKLSSSTPLVSCHLYCSCRLILSLKLSGSSRWDIHCSASLLFTLISSNLVVVDCKYVCFGKKIKYNGSNRLRKKPRHRMDQVSNYFSSNNVQIKKWGTRLYLKIVECLWSGRALEGHSPQEMFIHSPIRGSI